MTQKPAAQQYQKCLFAIDPAPQIIGFTDGDHWNGWATPRFELPAISRWLNETGNKWSFDPATDTLTVTDLGISEEEAADYTNQYRGGDLEVDGVSHHVYAVGSWFWTWVDFVETGQAIPCDACHGFILIGTEEWAKDPVTAETAHSECLKEQNRFQCPVCYEIFAVGAHQCTGIGESDQAK